MRQHTSGHLLIAAALACLVSMVPGFTTSASAQLVVGLRGDDAAAYEAEHERLFEALAEADTEDNARATESDIWKHWMRAPDLESARLMDQALELRRSFDLAGSVTVLDELIALTPDWAESWNQRATVRFMQGDFEGSLADIEETLQREPRHFGSLAGMAIILMQQGRAEQAQATLRRAVGIHPFLRERGLIVEPPGEDI